MNEILATIRRIVAEDGTLPGRSSGGAAAAPEEPLHLTSAVGDDGSVRQLPPTASGNPAPAPEASLTSVLGARAAPGEPPPRREPLSLRTTPAPVAGAGLVGETAALAAGAALARVAAAPRGPRSSPMVGERPLEDIVRELLRPLLQTWLDENLPPLVERLVEAEIARIAARAGGA